MHSGLFQSGGVCFQVLPPKGVIFRKMSVLREMLTFLEKEEMNENAPWERKDLSQDPVSLKSF